MKLSLSVLTAGKMEGKTIPITRLPFIIGRDPGCNLRPGSPLISKRHCAILARAGKIFLRDFDSTNGTFLDGQRIAGEVELADGQRLEAGPLAFQVSITITALVGQPSAPVPAKPAASVGDDEAAAALLLTLLDDGSPPPNLSDSGQAGVSDGTTVLLPPDGTPPEGNVVDPPAASGKPAKATSGDTSKSAKAILEKYMRRTRSPS